MLVVHRRHEDSCPHQHKGREFRKCTCPLWIDWRVGRKRIQKSLGTRDWGVAQIQARTIEVDGLKAAMPHQQNDTSHLFRSASRIFLSSSSVKGITYTSSTFGGLMGAAGSEATSLADRQCRKNAFSNCSRWSGTSSGRPAAARGFPGERQFLAWA
jgi:hypothetical protein